MDKRLFLKKLGMSATALSSTSFVLSTCRPVSKEEGPKHAENKPLKNWAWIKPPIGRWALDDWKKQLYTAKSSGIDAIVLECYNGHSTIYPHPDERITMRADLMEDVITICKENDLEFHSWMWTMPCNNEAIVKENPNWYAVNGLGQPAHTHPAYVDYYKFLDPCNPEVIEFIQANVNSFAQYSEIDGIHLDYVRLPDVILAEALQPNYDIVQDKEYPQYDYNYSELARKKFQDQTGIDPLLDLKEPSSNDLWRKFRYDSISQLVNNHLVTEAKKFDKRITGAVFPNWESVRQEWHKWNLDAFLPMLYHGFYNRDIDFIEEHTRKGLQRLNNQKPVYSGLFIPDLEPKELSQAYEAALSGGASGISLFALEIMTKDHWDALKKILKA